MDVNSIVTLDVEKAVAGGRMLARHDGQVVLVWGAIPGERVSARIERVAKHVLYGTTVDVVTPSPDRREIAGDWRCGGNVYAHIDYERQRALKAEILVDSLRRIGRIALPEAPHVVGSPATGYRMRARLHARDGRLGFYREESHELCDAAASGQLLPETAAYLSGVAADLRRDRADVLGVEIAENVPATDRGCYVELRNGEGRSLGASTVTDVLHPSEAEPTKAVRLRRGVRAFFQGNRYLLQPFVRHVLAQIPPGPVVDLYAGVGLFGLSIAAVRDESITLVEGDHASGTDLERNAETFGDRVAVRRESVERFLLSTPVGAVGTGISRPEDSTFILDPPRTGMTREVVANIILLSPKRVVFVSCDPATLARDLKIFTDAGYELKDLTAFDLFPNTAHIESVAVLRSRQS